jgi:hypothetical protein
MLFLFHPSTILAQTTQEWATKDARCVGSGDFTDVATIQGLECLFYNVLQVIVFFAGLAFFYMFISGGYNYLFSGGDSKKIASASSTLTMAILGLVGVIGSWLILSLIEKFTGVAITKFLIPG